MASALVLAVAATACIGRSGPLAGAEELAEIAASSDIAAYKAAYRFTLSGELTEAARYTLEIVQQPPAALRLFEVTTADPAGNEITIREWRIQNDDGFFTCARYQEGVRCIEQPSIVGMFGYQPVDEIYELVRDPGAFEEVERLDQRPTIAGERTTCFRAVPRPPTPPPIRSPQPRFTPESFEWELCYAPDGILLRAKRTITGDVPPDLQGRTQSLLEATSLTRSVASGDMELPGPLITPDQIPS